MQSKKEVVVVLVAVHYVLKFTNYERIRPIPHRRYSASVKVQIIKKRGTRILDEFVIYFHKDKKKWQVSWSANALILRDFQSRAVATLNRHFPKGVVNSTESAAA